MGTVEIRLPRRMQTSYICFNWLGVIAAFAHRTEAVLVPVHSYFQPLQAQHSQQIPVYTSPGIYPSAHLNQPVSIPIHNSHIIYPTHTTQLNQPTQLNSIPVVHANPMIHPIQTQTTQPTSFPLSSPAKYLTSPTKLNKSAKRTSFPVNSVPQMKLFQSVNLAQSTRRTGRQEFNNGDVCEPCQFFVFERMAYIENRCLNEMLSFNGTSYSYYLPCMYYYLYEYEAFLPGGPTCIGCMCNLSAGSDSLIPRCPADDCQECQKPYDAAYQYCRNAPEDELTACMQISIEYFEFDLDGNPVFTPLANKPTCAGCVAALTPQ